MFSLNCNEKKDPETVENKLEGAMGTAYEQALKWVTSLCSRSTFRGFTDSLFYTSLVFFKLPLQLTAHFIDNSQLRLTNNPFWNLEVCLFATNNLQITMQALLTVVIYSVTFVASIEITDSSLLSGNNTFCTTFSFCDVISRVLIYLSERFRFTGYGQFIQIPVNDVVTPHFSRCMLIVSRFQPFREQVLHNWYSWIISTELSHDDWFTEFSCKLKVWNLCLINTCW